MRDKKGKMGGMNKILTSVLLIVLIVGGLMWVGILPKPSKTLSIDNGGTSATTQDLSGGVTSCPNVATVTVTTNDIDKLTPGTDPDTVNFYITTDKKGSSAEGALTLTPLKTYQGLYAQNSTVVFATPVTFTTGCSNTDLPVEVVKSGAPTVSVLNDDGVTINSDANDQAVSGDANYGFELTIKAPAKTCAANEGALIIADFDKTYVNDVELSGLSEATAPDYLNHINVENGTSDGFKAFKFEGSLCDNAKREITGDFTTASGTPGEGNANIVWHWIPLNYDINQDTLQVIGPAAEDEDNNAITQGNTTFQLYTS